MSKFMLSVGVLGLSALGLLNAASSTVNAGEQGPVIVYNNGDIFGKIGDADEQPVETKALVTLWTLKGGMHEVAQVVTYDGAFEFPNVPNMSYLVTVEVHDGRVGSEVVIVHDGQWSSVTVYVD